MTRQLTVKQEAFKHAYCTNGGNGTQAALDAGYSENGAEVQAHHLLRNPKIQSAIETFKEANAAKASITVETLTKELQDIAKAATEKDQYSAAVSATNSVAKLHGLLTEDRKNARDPLTDAMSRIAKQAERKSIH